ncbi:MAG TPA: neutral zinc metallopeptidase [Thermoanaerobaculia bacterium]|nr:neutral zinc metallopeptidase [Thermoanaerobaculia bacterium]
MRWEGGEESDQVEDRRGFGGGRLAIGGCGTAIVVLVISLLTGANPLRVLQLLNGSASSDSSAPSSARPPSQGQGPGEDQGKKFVSVILKSTEDTWSSIFAANGRRYELPTLVLFTDATPTACGEGSEAQGPFYCPLDRKVYLDLGFFDELSRRFGAPGDFARAYVIAHEVGHHVQQQLGVADKVSALQQRVSREEANQLSVRLELQADCYAGVWGNRGARTGLVEPGDAEAGLRAAAAIGDDRLQRMATGRVQPESFTHGSSEQRVGWLKRGLESGDPSRCDTFSQ